LGDTRLGAHQPKFASALWSEGLLSYDPWRVSAENGVAAGESPLAGGGRGRVERTPAVAGRSGV
jgi:hypothetical protein